MRAQDCAIVLHREASFPGCVQRFAVIQTFTTWLGNKVNVGSYIPIAQNSFWLCGANRKWAYKIT